MKQSVVLLVDVVGPCRPSIWNQVSILVSMLTGIGIHDTQEVDEMKMDGAMPEEELAEEAEGLDAVIHITQNT